MKKIDKYLVGAWLCLGMAVIEFISERNKRITIIECNFDDFLKNNEYGKQEQEKTDVE